MRKFHFILLVTSLLWSFAMVIYIFFELITSNLTIYDCAWIVIVICINYFILGWIKAWEKKHFLNRYNDASNGE